MKLGLKEGGSAMSQPVFPTIHFTELQPARSGSQLAQEWEIYRREVGRLLSEGNEGKFILIKGDQVLGLWDTREEAMTVGRQHFPRQPFLVHQVQTRERVYRVR
jgi:hypothetical protein